MKTLSIKQPWAELIVQGIKKIENRNWRSQPYYRGPILIHAAKADDETGYHWLRRYTPEILDAYPSFRMPQRKQLARGAIIGRAELIDVVFESDDVFFTGPMGFVLANARRTKVVPYRGALGLFEVPLSIF